MWSSSTRYDPWAERFHDLMAHRVRDVLLVSSDYDAFVLEEDGRLRDRLFVEYSELNLVTMPNLVHVSTATEALAALRQRRFDLVLTTLRAEDPGVGGLSARIKEQFPDLPTVLLVLDELELRRLRARALPESLDRVFLWTGDTRILLAIIKLTEDALNVALDTHKTGVQVIIVVEDSIRYYSTFLALLYAELMVQSQSLIAEGLNSLHKLLRMRARPKILLAKTYEEALEFYGSYQNHVLAVISDVQFPSNGEIDAEAGFNLVRAVQAHRSDLPILLLSAKAGPEQATELGTEWVNKNSPVLLRSLQKFLKDNLGFGDFVFRLPDYTEVARARDMYELAQVISSVEERSLAYHASRGHFNVWLRARSMFDLADRLARVYLEDFSNLEDLRKFLLQAIQSEADREQVGIVADFSERSSGPAGWFVRLGQGSLGGKGRGVAFLHALVARQGLDKAFPQLPVRVPRTLAVATDCFDRFVEMTVGEPTQEGLLRQPLPEPFRSQLRTALKTFEGPLAVRSSSLLEDSQHQSCAGIYETVLVPNQSADPEVRLSQLCRAVRRVFASTYSDQARQYLRHTPFTSQDEKMAVMLQPVVGHRYGTRFYPHASGVALSFNHYPLGSQRPEQGVAALALGLGHTIVGGGRSLRFSPGNPGVLPHLTSPKDFLAYSQRDFYALDLEDGALKKLPLSTAESDGTLARVASVYAPDDDQFRDNLRLAGPRVVTFNDLLKWESLPLARVLQMLLERVQNGMGSAVELEFALDLGAQPCLYLLQVRPLAESPLDLAVGEPAGRVLARSPRSVGHGIVRDVHDIVMVTHPQPGHTVTPEIARQVAQMDESLQGRPYLLIGPGRWGSSDPALGIPIHVSQVQGAAAILELPFADRFVEPSIGSHFYHELVSRRVGYLCFDTNLDHPQSFLDRQWLLAQPVAKRSSHLRWIRLDQAVTLYLDGRHSRAVITLNEPT
ncbi:hypothetical protein IV102_18840 [bacterium]|nr:hypothetical protein [bacterium]